MAENCIPGPLPATTTLLYAYLAAHYRVRIGDGRWLALVVGQPAPARLARAFPTGSMPLLTLITASNPQSQVQPAAANRAADAALRADLDALGQPVLRATATDADGDWKEPGWLVAGLDTATCDALARRYGQAGLLHWHAGEPVRLRMYRMRPATGHAHPGARWVDWTEGAAP